jgi:hypothetical protein
MTWSFTIMNCWQDNRAYERNDTFLPHSIHTNMTHNIKDLIHLKTVAYSHEMLLWCGHNKIIMRMGVLTALLSLLSCATVLLDITFLQNVGEQLTQQHTKSSQKTGIFILNTFEDYLLSVNWLMFERLFTWTYIWHTIPTTTSVLDQLTWSLPRSLTLTDADVS